MVLVKSKSEIDPRALSSSRWFVPLLALLHREQGARYVRLSKRLGLSRSMLRRVLGRALAAGWVMRNPGHGHPLRPEYILTESGRAAAAWCDRVIEARELLGLGAPGDLGRWALPLVAAMAQRDWMRFSQLQAMLEPITPRALSLALKQLLRQDLLERRLEESYPPLPFYRLTSRGALLAEAAF